MARPELILAAAKPFARGGCRLIYRDPRGDRRAVKITVSGGGEGARKRAEAGWIRYLHRKDYYDENNRQWREHRKLARRLGLPWPRHLSGCYGLVRTDVGVGLVVERIVNADGSAALNMEEHLGRHGLDARCRRALKELRRFLIARRVLLRDAAANNIVLREERDGTLFPVVVDGLGNSEFIPVSGWIPCAGRRKIRKRWRALLANVRKLARKARDRDAGPPGQQSVKGLM